MCNMQCNMRPLILIAVITYAGQCKRLRWHSRLQTLAHRVYLGEQPYAVIPTMAVLPTNLDRRFSMLHNDTGGIRSY